MLELSSYYAPISSLQHFNFCNRQAALIHLDEQWSDNWLTIKGKIVHENIDAKGIFKEKNIVYLKSAELINHKLKIYGNSDLIAFLPNKQIIPIEYKRGKKGEWEHNKIQLCAQAFCLEEMLNINISLGLIYFHASNRKIEVPLDNNLRNLTKETIEKFLKMIQDNNIPNAVYSEKCPNCSMIKNCEPKINLNKETVANYFNKYMEKQ